MGYGMNDKSLDEALKLAGTCPMEYVAPEYGERTSSPGPLNNGDNWTYFPCPVCSGVSEDGVDEYSAKCGSYGNTSRFWICAKCGAAGGAILYAMKRYDITTYEVVASFLIGRICIEEHPGTK